MGNAQKHKKSILI
jgi:hypothetical protein